MNLIAMLMLAADLNGQPLPDVVLLDFTAGYCQPCQQMVPVLQRMERDQFPIRKIDITEHPKTSRQYNVDRIPTLILLVDGEEVDRFVGLTAENELRRAMNDAARKLDMRRRAEGGLPANAESADDPADEPPEPEAVVSVDEPRAGIRGIFDRMRRLGGDQVSRDEMEHPDFRGQSPEDAPALNDKGAMQASVRVRLIDGRMHDFGTGTIVHSTAGQSTILTCAHVFKEVGADAAILIDVFRDGEVLKYPAEIIGGDHDADVAFLKIQNASPLPTAPIARQLRLQKQESVFSIGCNNGDLPTRLNMKVIEVDRYEGPQNIVCTNDPVQGRSGGGLFNAKGELVGVCSGAFRTANEGLYNGVRPIRDLALQHKLSYLTDVPNSPFKTAQVPSDPPPDTNAFEDNDIFDELFEENPSPFSESNRLEGAPVFNDAAPQEMPDPFATAALPETAFASVANPAPTEITVIIDSNDPTKGKRVVVIPRPSPWLLELLTGESSGAAGTPDSGMTDSRSARLSATSSRRATRKIPVGRTLPPAR